MSDKSGLQAAIAERIAAGWIAFGAQLAGIDDLTPIDPDALVAATAADDGGDPRVRDVAIDWCVRYGTIINTGRLRRVAREMEVDPGALARFGGEVHAAGGPRWPFAQEGVRATTRGKAVAEDLLSPARLSWRIRAGFGVSARADVLTTLLTTPPKPVSVADLARRSWHSKRNTALTVDGLSLAGIVRTSRQGNRNRVWLDRQSPLRELLEPDGVPDIDWPSRWTVVWAAARADASTRAVSPSVRLVETRRATERVLPMLEPAALPYPDMSATGAAWGNAFDEWLRDLAFVLSSMGA